MLALVHSRFLVLSRLLVCLPSLSTSKGTSVHSAMSSFLSDSAIGLGGSDSGGSIEQPIIDREVILIGDSSSKDTY